MTVQPNTDRATSNGKSVVFDKHALLTRISDGVLTFAGKPEAFFGICAFIILWLIAGPFFGFEGIWQSVIHTAATVVTLLMVFIIQDSQNRDTATIHLKLDELIRANEAAKNELLDLEHLTRDQLDKLIARYKDLASTSNAPAQNEAERAIDEALTEAKSEAC